MKKLLVSLMALMIMVSSMCVSAFADEATVYDDEVTATVTYKGGDSFEEDYSAIAEAFKDMLPGDTIRITININNDYNQPMNWYVQNSVAKSFETSTEASGGAYTYKLVYATDGTTLYDSNAVGGEGEEGLMQVAEQLNASDGDDYTYFAQLPANGSGVVTLEISLLGVTQVNSFENTDAELNIGFAVSNASTTSPSPSSPVVTPPKTGDEGPNLVLWIVIMVVSAAAIAALIVVGRKERKKGGAEK